MIIIFIASWIQTVWAPDKFTRSTNFFNTIFESTIARTKQMQLQMIFWGFCREIEIKKISFKLKMAESFIIYRIYWPMLA